MGCCLVRHSRSVMAPVTATSDQSQAVLSTWIAERTLQHTAGDSTHWEVKKFCRALVNSTYDLPATLRWALHAVGCGQGAIALTHRMKLDISKRQFLQCTV